MLRHWSRLGLVLAVTVVLSGLALAHDDDDYRGQGVDARQYGYQQGYRDGYDHGRADRFRRAGYNFHSEAWEHPDRGYEKYMGSKWQYKKSYRDGYRAGYDDAFYGRAGRFGNIFGGRNDDDRYRRGDGDHDADDGYPQRVWDSRDVGYATGYRDGQWYADQDLRARRPFAPEQTSGYKHADHGYDKHYGDKQQYAQRYRQGLVEGYRSVYRR